MPQYENQKLIASIYAATLSPNNFDELIDNLDTEIVRLVSSVTGVQNFDYQPPLGEDFTINNDVLAELAGHIETALRIQTEIGHLDHDVDPMERIVEQIPNPAVIFNQQEQIVRKNSQANMSKIGSYTKISQMFSDVDQMDEFRKSVSTLLKDGTLASIPINLDLEHGSNTCVIVKKIQAADIDNQDQRLFLLTIADFGFDGEVSAMFQNTYHLTDAEVEVAILLASGKKPEEIAARRYVSLDTVRTQIKHIKNKTRVRDIPDLVRRVCGFSTGILVSKNISEGESVQYSKSSRTGVQSLTLNDGRRMDFFVQGAKEGEPVLLLHNMPYGVELPAGAQEHAKRQGLRIIAPYRPGYANSDPLPGLQREELLDQCAQDLAEMLDQLSISKVKLIGNVAGSSYAIRFASRFPERASEIILVSRAPIWRTEWLKHLPKRHRLISILLLYMPKLASLLAWSKLAYINKQDAAGYIRSSVNGSKADIRALENPETVTLISDGIKHGLKHGVEPYCRDWEVMDVDLSKEAALLCQPIVVLHGADDRMVSREFCKAFVNEVPRAKLELVEGAGHFLFYSHWQYVMDALSPQIKK